MFKLPTQPQSILSLLNEGINLFVFHFSKLLPLILIDVALSLWLHLWVPAINSPQPPVMIAAVQNHLSHLFLYSIVTLVLHTAIFYRIGLLIVQSDISNLQALFYSIKKLPPIFLATLLYFILAFLGLSLIIPGIFILVSLRFFTPIILFEQASVFDAFQKSHQLVWKNWWRTAVILMAPLLFSMFVGLMFSALVEGLLTMEATLQQAQIKLLVQLTYLTIDKLLTPLFYTVILLQYYDLKRRKQPSHSSETDFLA